MTIAADIAAVRFDLDAAEPTTLNSLKYTVNNKLEIAQLALETEGANVAAGSFSSFTLNNISEANATISVYYSVARVINHGIDKGASDDEIMAEIKRLALRNAIMEYKINSSSNMSVELDTAVKVAWGRFYSDFN